MPGMVECDVNGQIIDCRSEKALPPDHLYIYADQHADVQLYNAAPRSHSLCVVEIDGFHSDVIKL